MDLTDTSLMYIANKENIKDIVSIDSDFDIYRTLKKQNLNNLLIWHSRLAYRHSELDSESR